MRTAQEIADDLSVFWTTLTFFCVYIIDAKLSVKLLCCLKDKKQRRVCLSRADCYDQSSRRLTIKQPAELRQSPACFETTDCGKFCAVISNSNWTEWSTTIQGVISKLDEHEAQGRFEITSTITPWIVRHRVELLINRIYDKF